MPSTLSDINTESAKPKTGGESIKMKSNSFDSFNSFITDLNRSDPINLAGSGGIVIIRYPGGQRGSGGSVSTSGGFTRHIFNSAGSSGTFTA